MIQYSSQINGLGSTIGWLSFLLYANSPVTIQVSPIQTGQLDVVNRLKQLFNIPDSKISLEVDNNLTDLNCVMRHGDAAKLFAPYIEYQNVPNWKKPCIGFACSNKSEDIFTKDQFVSIDNSKEFPYNRYYPIEDNSKIFELIKRAGYDVITFDHLNFGLEQKITTMANLCDAVIGYEGGLCHIAHTLGIPTIILPWKFTLTGNIMDTYNHCHSQLLHLDKKTFFVDHIYDILNWSPNTLISKIDELKEGQGNNMFLNTARIVKMKSDFSALYLDHIEVPNLLTPWEKDFIKIRYDSLKLGGIREIEIV
jgi:hypothetical protein